MKAVHVELADSISPKYRSEPIREAVKSCGRVDAPLRDAGVICRDSATTTDEQWFVIIDEEARSGRRLAHRGSASCD